MAENATEMRAEKARVQFSFFCIHDFVIRPLLLGLLGLLGSVAFQVASSLLYVLSIQYILVAV